TSTQTLSPVQSRTNSISTSPTPFISNAPLSLISRMLPSSSPCWSRIGTFLCCKNSNLACYVIKHIDLCEDPDRSAVLHHHQRIACCQRGHGFLDRGVCRENRAGILDQRIDGLFMAMVVFFQHVIQQIHLFQHADQLTT